MDILQAKIKELEASIESAKLYHEYLDTDQRILNELLSSVEYDGETIRYMRTYISNLKEKILELRSTIVAEIQLLEYYKMCKIQDESSSMPMH
jgi:hypothetical protein